MVALLTVLTGYSALAENGYDMLLYVNSKLYIENPFLTHILFVINKHKM